MSVVLKNDFDRVAAELEDTQHSLVAALARIEAFRLRERVIGQELARLRAEQQRSSQGGASVGGPPDAAAPAAVAPAGPAAAPGPGPAAHAGAHAPGEASAPAGAAAAAADEPQAGAAAAASRGPDRPAYITEIGAHLPVLLLGAGGRRVPASVVITPEFIDFVEVRARIRKEQFVGFTAAQPLCSGGGGGGGGRRPQTAGAAAGEAAPSPPPAALWQSLLPACLSPAPPDGGAAAAAAAAQQSLEMSAASAGRGDYWDGGSPGGGAPRARSGGWRHGRGNGGALSWPASPRAGGGGGGGDGGSPTAAAAAAAAAAWLEGVSATSPRGGGGGGRPGAWQVLWRSERQQQSLCFEATQEARALLHQQTTKWLGHVQEDEFAAQLRASQQQQQQQQSSSDGGGGIDNGPVEIVLPRLLDGAATSSFTPPTSEPSALVAPRQVAALAAAMPPRFRTAPWNLVYSTARHGISLQTLYRRAAGATPSVLAVKDAGGHVFGAFCTEPWRMAPRFFGTGETFVFQLEPHRVCYPWRVRSPVKNDYFMYATQDCMAVGGQGRFAIWLDSDLLRGSSGACGTFGSPCLAAKDEFSVSCVELWQIGGS